MKINDLNNLSVSKAKIELEKCCFSTKWLNTMINLRPFNSVEDIYLGSDKSWKKCVEIDFVEAFQGHPKIGDLSSLSAKFLNTSEIASKEQRGMDNANTNIIKRLAKKNIEYESKFGFIFIVLMPLLL